MTEIKNLLDALSNTKNNANNMAKSLEELGEIKLSNENEEILTTLIENHLKSMQIVSHLIDNMKNDIFGYVEKEGLYSIIDKVCDEEEKKL